MAWVWIIAAAIISGSLPVTFYYRSVKKLPAERLADMSFISPAVAGIVGILFLGERLSIG
ncbi:MAG: EamA family transporter [Candidatus Saccharimonadales bacterium]